jgi:16S rRNA A1518/A1519 N6-dimethyltransferase RsmA/KsgA/DIM1 with predicted DNA glycosylase/AP lyase activity
MVRASLRSLIPDSVELGRIFADASISPEARPEALEIDDFVALARAWVQR